MPGDGCLNAFALMAVVRNTWSPQTIGDDQPRPGTSAFHATLIVVDHVFGSESIVDTPRPAWPRNCGHVASAGTGGAGTSAVTKNTMASAMRTAAVYTRAALAHADIDRLCS